MQFDILETNTNLAIGSVWSNHCDHAEIFMLDCLNELEDFIISWEKNIAFFELSFILNHTYKVAQKTLKVKKNFQLFYCTILLRGGPSAPN